MYKARQLGFHTKKLPHTTRIPFFVTALHQMVQFRHPFQSISQPLYEGPGSVVKCFVYAMMVDPRHEIELLEDMPLFGHPDLEFHLWASFKDSKKRVNKVGIINEMNTFNVGHSSILIKGFEENCLMRLTDNSGEIVDAFTMDHKNTTPSSIQEALDRDLNTKLQQVTCVNFLYSHFVDSEDNTICVQINGPCNGLT